MTLPGFRRGRVPRRLLERRFGEELNKQVRERLIEKHYELALKQEGLEPVAEPELEAEGEGLDYEKPLKFEVTVEVKPKIELAEYKGLVIFAKEEAVSEEEIEGEVERLRKANARLQPVKEGSVERDDQVVAELRVEVNGQEVWRRERGRLSPETDRIAGIPVEGLEGKLVGSQIGDEISLDVTLPRGFEGGHNGERAVLRMKIIERRRMVLPELNDGWAKEFGYESLEEIRKRIRAELEEVKKQKERAEMLKQVEERLLELHQFDLPETPIRKYTDALVAEERRRLSEQNVDPQERDRMIAEKEEEIRLRAKREIRLSYIYEAIAEKEKIFVTEDEVDTHLSEHYSHLGDVERARTILDRVGQLDTLREVLRRRKVEELLLECARIESEGSAEKGESNEAGANGD